MKSNLNIFIGVYKFRPRSPRKLRIEGNRDFALSIVLIYSGKRNIHRITS